MNKLRAVVAAVFGALCGVLLLDSPRTAQEVQVYPEVFQEIKHDVSPRLRDIPPKRSEGPPHKIPVLRTRGPTAGAGQPDGAL